MDIAKVFTNGRSQAIRLPKNCRFEDDEVLVNKIADRWHSMLESLDLFTDDFLSTEIEPLPIEEQEDTI